MSETSILSEALPQVRPQRETEAKGSSPKEEVLPKDMPVVNVKDIMMYAENMDKLESKKLIPYVVYLDEQFKEIVKKRRQDAKVVLILYIVVMSISVIGLVVCGIKLFGYLLGKE
ncbi:hypothetical protein EHEL_041010 [Encephalitozoon hellem ATCC 50504]|uniref:Uncharacterized protein n=1 Tax=Encephalitozoon hellem TaxID=27973 RepID=A0A9Q9F9D7_ENCHE|nr:uncharacterized protein EHEL_041010 [Encephalitozoon hellem ATCC 50504]AFM98151.1 hypothetical protein EHEL_041010 [Encephalitozoon hellem ATCC 50504]UTX42997.1 hypothetical protein GPU96_04g07300 [Encephalitozoon hellem]|eukprot:XP_003887132.1 hypothetical protein EHEL_041010 [Encephalitozoon hellem ATCC 50504]